MKKYLVILLLLCASHSFAGESRILAQRVAANGALIGTPVTIYNSASGPQSKARISFYDDRFLVVWNEWNGTDLDVKAVRVEMDGTVLDTTPLNISTGSRTQALPDVAADSTGWVVVWHAFDSTDVFPSLFARRVDYDGTLNTPVQFGNSSTIGSAPRIAWDSVAGKFIVMFTSTTSVGGQDLRWTLLTTTLADTLSSQLLYPSNTGDIYYPPAAMPGGGWTFIVSGPPEIGWSRSSPIVAAGHIETTGLLNTSGYLGSGANVSSWGYLSLPDGDGLLDNNEWPHGVADVVTDASYVIAIWTRYHNGGLTGRSLYDGDLYATRVDEYDPVEPTGGTAISTASGISECNPSIAGDGTGNLLAVYDKSTGGSTEITSRILTVDGSGIAPSSEVTIRSDSTGRRRSQSAVAYGDDGAGTTEFMVVWTEGWWGAL